MMKLEWTICWFSCLENGDFVSDEVYQQMTDFSERFDKGIYYGIGMFYIDFSEQSSSLVSMTDVYGGMGVLGEIHVLR